MISIFPQIWIFFKTLKSFVAYKGAKTITWIGNFTGAVFFCILSIVSGYYMYAFYRIPNRNIQLYCYRIEGEVEKQNLTLTLNLDYGGEYTEKYRTDFRPGIIVDLSYKDTAEIKHYGRHKVYINGKERVFDVTEIPFLFKDRFGSQMDSIESMYGFYYSENKFNSSLNFE